MKAKVKWGRILLDVPKRDGAGNIVTKQAIDQFGKPMYRQILDLHGSQLVDEKGQPKIEAVMEEVTESLEWNGGEEMNVTPALLKRAGIDKTPEQFLMELGAQVDWRGYHVELNELQKEMNAPPPSIIPGASSGVAVVTLPAPVKGEKAAVNLGTPKKGR